MRRLIRGLSHADMRSIGVSPRSVTLVVKISSETLVQQMKTPMVPPEERVAELETLHLVARGLMREMREVTFEHATENDSRRISALAAVAGPVQASACVELAISGGGASKVWIDGLELMASNDWDSLGGDGVALIDADFLASLPPAVGLATGGGRTALETLSDASPLRLCTHPSAQLDVLGT
jgi:hypothetical protein